MTRYTHCVLCNTEANEPFNNQSKDVHAINCPHCGHYFITFEALLELPGDLTAEEKGTLSAYIRTVSNQKNAETVTLGLDESNSYHNLLLQLNL